MPHPSSVSVLHTWPGLDDEPYVSTLSPEKAEANQLYLVENGAVMLNSNAFRTEYALGARRWVFVPQYGER